MGETLATKVPEAYYIIRGADGKIKQIMGPDGELPATEEQFRKIMEV